jgi:hypothetical protein
MKWLKNLFIKKKVVYIVKYAAAGDPDHHTAGIFRSEAKAHELIGKRMLEDGAYDTYRFYIETLVAR